MHWATNITPSDKRDPELEHFQQMADYYLLDYGREISLSIWFYYKVIVIVKYFFLKFKSAYSRRIRKH